MSSMSSKPPRDGCSNCISSSAPSPLGVDFFFKHIAWSSLKGNHRNNSTTCPWKIADSSMKPIDLRALGRASQSQASQGSNASWVCGFVTMAMTNVKLCWPPWLEDTAFIGN